jgi:hypothetical protein
MTQLILHIGTGKTGSTAIQMALAGRADSLPASGFAYPAGTQGHHNELEALLLPPARWHRVHRVEFGGREQELVDRAGRLLADCRAALARDLVTVLSSEYLYSLRAADVHALLRLFDGCAAPATAVLYVRQPSAYLLSSLQQFLKHEHDLRGFMNQTYPFRNAVRNWTLALGRDGLLVREFSRTGLAGGDVVTDFASVLARLAGVPLDLGAPDTAANVSLSAEECVVLQEFKRAAAIALDPALRRRNQAINAAVSRSARGLDLTRMQFRPGIAELVDRHHAPDLALLRTATGIHFGIEPAPLDPAARAELDRWTAVADVGELLQVDPDRLAALRERVQLQLRRAKSPEMHPGNDAT